MKYPIAAALKACTTSSVRASALSWRLGAISSPDSAAKDDPIIQASRRTPTELVPVTDSRSGSSTTARSSTPRRVNRRNAYSAPAAAKPTTATMICSHSTLTSSMRTVVVGRNDGKTPDVVLNMMPVIETIHTISPTMAPIWRVRSAAASWRESNSSR